tara:strand:+ start:192107 stop:192931 length:825 start_codon:yes stop_codon:yes gene_type:complete
MMKFKKWKIKKAVFIGILTFATSVFAEKEDYGFVVVNATLPHYLGSNEYYGVTFPFPLALSQKQTWHDEYKSTFYLDFDANLRLPIGGADITDSAPENITDEDARVISNTTNYARRGMGYLPPAGYLGAKAGLNIGQIRLETAITPGIQLGHDWESAGVLSRVTLSWTPLLKNSGTNSYMLRFMAEAQYGDKTYHNMYYGVSAEHAIAGRSEFDGKKSGYTGYFLGIELAKRFGPIVAGASAGYYNMDGSIVEESPLVVTKSNFGTGFMLGYVF